MDIDKVPHRRLMEKIAKHGIGGKLYKVIENWLSGRKQSLYKRICFKLASGIKWSSTRFSAGSCVVFDLYK